MSANDNDAEHMRIDDLLEMAARDLPEGWSVRIDVECDGAWVKAVAPDGVEYEVDSDEMEISDLVRDAIVVATANDQVDTSDGKKIHNPIDTTLPPSV